MPITEQSNNQPFQRLKEHSRQVTWQELVQKIGDHVFHYSQCIQLVDLTVTDVPLAQPHMEKPSVDEVIAISSHTNQISHKNTQDINLATHKIQMTSHTDQTSQLAQLKTLNTSTPPAYAYPKISANFDKPKHTQILKPTTTPSQSLQNRIIITDAPSNPQAINLTNSPTDTNVQPKK